MIFLVILLGALTVGIWTYLLMGAFAGQWQQEGQRTAGNILYFRTMNQIYAFRFVLYVLGVVLGYRYGLTPVNKAILIVFGLIAAHFGGLWALKKLRENWKDRFDDQLEEASRLIANSLRAGLGFLQALEIVTREMPDPLREKFQEVVSNVRLGMPMREAMAQLEKSVPESEELKNFTTAVVIQLQTGGSLAEVIDQVAKTISQRRRLRRRINSLTAEGRLSAMVIVALPFFMAFAFNWMDPNYMRPMFEHWIGLLIWGLVIFLDGFAWWIIMKIVNIEV